MNNLYEALEICLQDIEQGVDVETVLFRYPDLAEELRPILEASAEAKRMAVPAPSADVVRRHRARVLQHAAQMREAKVKSSRRIWFVSLRRIAVTLTVVTLLFVSGTRLVGASSNTLPGDNLYPVKRTWEGLRLLFTFNVPERDALEVEHENERLHEVTELLAEGRSEEVDFNGLVTSQTGNEWVVAGVQVLISSQTGIRDSGITVGSPVRVRGITQGNGTVLAERIQLLSANAIVPKGAEEHESEEGNGNNSGPRSGTEGPKVEETATPEIENANSSSNSGSNENSNENENSNLNENSGSQIENNNQNGNENSGQESNNNENEHQSENNSGGGENNSSGGGESGGED